MKTVFSIFCFVIVECLTLIARTMILYIDLTRPKQNNVLRIKYKLIKFENISSQIDIISIS